MTVLPNSFARRVAAQTKLKLCRVCLQPKPLRAFPNTRKSPDARRDVCRGCLIDTRT